MIKFDIKNMKITWKELIHEEFEVLVNLDKSVSKENALKDLKAVFFIADKTFDNPYRDRPYFSKVEDVVKFVYKGKKPKHWDLIEAAIDKYILGNETSEDRFVEVYNDKLDEITMALKEMDVTNTESFNVARSMMEIMKVFKAMPEIMLSKDKAIASIRKEAKTKIKGSVKPSPADFGLLKL